MPYFTNLMQGSIDGLSKPSLAAIEMASSLQLIARRDELNLKVQLLTTPLELCVSHAVKGNSVLKPVVDAALTVLNKIEDLEDTLKNQDANFVRP